MNKLVYLGDRGEIMGNLEDIRQYMAEINIYLDAIKNSDTKSQTMYLRMIEKNAFKAERICLELITKLEDETRTEVTRW